jgi:hypothetical protein
VQLEPHEAIGMDSTANNLFLFPEQCVDDRRDEIRH